MTPNWNVIRRKGEQGLLNANETDALVTMAESAWLDMEDAWAGVEDTCPWCYQREGQCCDACPVDVLERVEPDEPNIWFGPRPECDPAAAAEGKRRMLDVVERKFRRRVVAIQPWRVEVFRALPGGNCERIEEIREGVYDVYDADGRNLRVGNGMIVEWEANDGLD